MDERREKIAYNADQLKEIGEMLGFPCRVIEGDLELVPNLFPQWINVEDRLPEEEGLYILLWSNGNYVVGLKDYIVAHKNYSFHWMPLPQPPKEGE